MSNKYELPTDDAIHAEDIAFEEWWKFFKETQGIKDDNSIRVFMGAKNFARCIWLAAQEAAYERAAQTLQTQCEAKGTGCLAHCTHPESIQAVRALAGDIDVEAAQREYEAFISEPGADCPECGAQIMQMHREGCSLKRRDLPPPRTT